MKTFRGFGGSSGRDRHLYSVYRCVKHVTLYLIYNSLLGFNRVTIPNEHKTEASANYV